MILWTLNWYGPNMILQSENSSDSRILEDGSVRALDLRICRMTYFARPSTWTSSGEIIVAVAAALAVRGCGFEK